LPSFFRWVCRRNIAAVCAQQSISGNGVGLHYSRFYQSWRIFIMENHSLGNRRLSENRLSHRRIREDGLTIRLKYQDHRNAVLNSGFGKSYVQIARLIWHAALQRCNFRRHVPKWHFCQLRGHWANSVARSTSGRHPARRSCRFGRQARRLEPIGGIPPAEAGARYYAQSEGSRQGGVTQFKRPPANPTRFNSC
jgi:hypothetical protein